MKTQFKQFVSWTSVVALAVALIPLHAEEAADAVELVYKYREGEVARMTTTTTGKGTTTVSGAPGQRGPQAIPLDVEHEALISTRTTKVHEDKSADVQMSFDQLTVETNVMNHLSVMTWTKDGIEMTVDGQEQPAPEELTKNINWIGKPFKLKLSPRGKVLDADWEALKALEQFMPGMNLKQMMESSQPSLPDKPVKPGDTWTQVQKIDLPGQAGKTGGFEINTEYTYLGMEALNDKQCAKIDVSGTVLMEGAEMQQPGVAGAGLMGLPPGSKLSIDGMHLYMDGLLYFDPEVGNVAEQRIDMDMNMSMTISGKVGKGKETKELDIGTDIEMKMSTVAKVEILKPEGEAPPNATAAAEA